jgi:hypothetical protein
MMHRESILIPAGRATLEGNGFAHGECSLAGKYLV